MWKRYIMSFLLTPLSIKQYFYASSNTAQSNSKKSQGKQACSYKSVTTTPSFFREESKRQQGK